MYESMRYPYASGDVAPDTVLDGRHWFEEPQVSVGTLLSAHVPVAQVVTTFGHATPSTESHFHALSRVPIWLVWKPIWL